MEDSKMEQSKKWYLSKTVWINVIALAGLIVQTQTGFLLTPEVQAMALTLVNLAVRAVTKQELTV
jgi:fumarate reductase subunit C